METIHIERLRQQADDSWAWVAEAETFDLENDFSINDSNLDGELCRMGKLMVRYGGVASELGANLRRKEEEVKLVYAQVAGATRSTHEQNGTKVTEKSLDSEVIQSTQYQAALGQLHLVRADAVKADHWWRSISKKADLLQALVYRQNAEIKKGGY